MIEIKPLLKTPCTCPDCGCKDPDIKRFIFQGVAPLVECQCNCCEIYYYHTIPISYQASFPVGISKTSGKTSYDQKAARFAGPLIESVRTEEKYSPSIVKIIYKEYREVIILDCLDTDYGNIFYKFMNAFLHLESDSDKGLIMVIPSVMMWMVPTGVAEVWIVEARIFRLDKFIHSLDIFYQKEQLRFDKIYLSKALINPDIKNIPIEIFLKKKKKLVPSQSRKKPFHISFSLREDRFWLTGKLDSLFFRFADRFHLVPYLKFYFCFKQNRNYSLFAEEISKRTEISKGIRSICFTATGTGNTGKLGKNICDERRMAGREDPMEYWSGIYAESDITIGVYGANMIIPEALSGAFIEIMTGDAAEDVSLNANSSLYGLNKRLYIPEVNAMVETSITILLEN